MNKVRCEFPVRVRPRRGKKKTKHRATKAIFVKPMADRSLSVILQNKDKLNGSKSNH